MRYDQIGVSLKEGNIRSHIAATLYISYERVDYKSILIRKKNFYEMDSKMPDRGLRRAHVEVELGISTQRWHDRLNPDQKKNSQGRKELLWSFKTIELLAQIG